MRIERLLKNAEELKDFAWEILSFKLGDREVWKESDRPKLQPFFDFSESSKERLMTQEERDSFDFYQKCSKDYAESLFEIRDAVSELDIDTLSRNFLLEPIYNDCYDTDENGNDIDEDGNIIPELSRESLELSKSFDFEGFFPCVMVGAIDSGFDRMGSVSMICIDYVELNKYRHL